MHCMRKSRKLKEQCGSSWLLSTSNWQSSYFGHLQKRVPISDWNMFAMQMTFWLQSMGQERNARKLRQNSRILSRTLWKWSWVKKRPSLRTAILLPDSLVLMFGCAGMPVSNALENEKCALWTTKWNSIFHWKIRWRPIYCPIASLKGMERGWFLFIAPFCWTARIWKS